jgi:hypothetical protein
LVDHIGTVAVTPADAAHVTDVMDQGREREMDPVVGLDIVLEPSAAQNVLADIRLGRNRLRAATEWLYLGCRPGKPR